MFLHVICVDQDFVMTSTSNARGIIRIYLGMRVETLDFFRWFLAVSLFGVLVMFKTAFKSVRQQNGVVFGVY